ncbi:TetR/AcrR family transcriptional regulator [Pseudobacillus sp. FSL P4-0506]|uniref:TetR/AcrR family transcriptional regulator n=1 Tax=unclassified Pseudobacillus TaxID=2619284 RepID=UPI0030FCFCA7
MARKRAFTEEELLDAAEKLIIEHGYNGFHLKRLAEHLVSGARSTIYQYFSNREEVAAACMKRAMDRTVSRASRVDEKEPIPALRQLLRIYMDEADLHFILGDIRKIDVSQSKKAEELVGEVMEMHQALSLQLERLFKQAQQEGDIREDVPFAILASLFFQLINTPNVLALPIEEWADYLFEVWYRGSGLN